MDQILLPEGKIFWVIKNIWSIVSDMTVEDIVITEVSTFENKWLYIFFTWLQYTILYFYFFLMSPHAHSTSPTYILTDANARDHPKSRLSLFKLTINFLVSTRSTMELLRLATCHSDWSKTSISVRDTLTLDGGARQLIGCSLRAPGCPKKRTFVAETPFEYFFLHPATTLNWSKNVKTWPTTTLMTLPHDWSNQKDRVMVCQKRLRRVVVVGCGASLLSSKNHKSGAIRAISCEA